jgi:hypothetical protein
MVVIGNLRMRMVVRMMMVRPHLMRVSMKVAVVLRLRIGRRSVVGARRHATSCHEKNDSPQHQQ